MQLFRNQAETYNATCVLQLKEEQKLTKTLQLL